MSKKVITTTVDETLYKKIKILAVEKNANVNELIEEGFIYILDKYKNKDVNE